MDQDMGQIDPILLREERHQLLFDLLRGLRFREPHAMGEPEDVRVHDEAGSDGESRPGRVKSSSIVFGTSPSNVSVIFDVAPWIDLDLFR